MLLARGWRLAFPHNLNFKLKLDYDPQHCCYQDADNDRHDRPTRAKTAKKLLKLRPRNQEALAALVETLAKLFEAYVNSNGSKYCRSFVKGLVDKAAETTIGLNITRHDVDKACQRRHTQSSIIATPAMAIAPAIGSRYLCLPTFALC